MTLQNLKAPHLNEFGNPRICLAFLVFKTVSHLSHFGTYDTLIPF